MARFRYQDATEVEQSKNCRHRSSVHPDGQTDCLETTFSVCKTWEKKTTLYRTVSLRETLRWHRNGFDQLVASSGEKRNKQRWTPLLRSPWFSIPSLYCEAKRSLQYSVTNWIGLDLIQVPGASAWIEIPDVILDPIQFWKIDPQLTPKLKRRHKIWDYWCENTVFRRVCASLIRQG